MTAVVAATVRTTVAGISATSAVATTEVVTGATSVGPVDTGGMTAAKVVDSSGTSVVMGAVGSVVTSVGAPAARIGGMSAGGTVAGIGGTSGLGRIAVGSGAILVGVVRGGLMGLRGASVVRFGGTSVVGIHAGVRERATPGVARRIRVGVQVTRVGVRAAVRGGASGLRIRAGAVAGTSVVGIGGRTGRRRPDRVGTTRRFRKGSPGPSSIVV